MKRRPLVSSPITHQRGNIFAPTARQRGNIFAMLFGAVALTGVLAAVGMQTLTGPVTTITRVTQRNIADNHLLMNGKILVNAAVSGTAGGDIDSDGVIEPAAFVPAGGGETPPANGGYLPADLGLALTDPWGTKYGYCVWDHGTSNSSTNRITGDNTASAPTQPVIAIIAAGPDKTFQTACDAFASGPINVSKAGGSDDILFKYTYAEASATSNGLWTLNESDQTKAELKDSGGTVNVVIDRSTGIGDFLGITTDTLVAKTSNVTLDGGLKLDTETNVTACAAADAGVVRYNAASGKLEVCNGTAWRVAGSDLWLENGTHIYSGNTGNVGIGTSAPTQKLDVQGNVNASGNLSVGGTGAVTGDFAVNTDKFTVAAATGNTAVAGTLGVTGATTLADTLGVAGNAAFDGDTLFVDASAGKVGVGTASPANLLDVAGTTDMGALGSYVVGHAPVHVADGTSNLYMDGNKIISDAALVIGTTGTFGLTLVTDEAVRLSIDAAGGVSVAGTLGVGGAATLSDTLSVAGNAALDGDTLFVDAANDTVGIGTASPLARLDVDGGIRLGAHSVCAAGGANNGTIRYDSTIKKMQVCVDGAWSSVSSIDALDDIGDVDVPAPNDNEVLAWDNTAGNWVAKNINTLGPAAVSPAGNDGSIQFKDGSDLGADADNLHWDDPNNRLGVGTDTPAQTLDVVGTAAVSGNTSVGGTLGVTGAATLASTLTVAGNATFDTSTLFVNAGGNNVGIGTILPDASAVLELASTAAGFLPPRMSATNRNAIASPATGLIIFNNTTNKLQIYDGTDWLNVGVASGLGSSMVDGWPDAVNCGGAGFPTIYYLTYAPFADGKFYYRNIYDAGDRSVWFNADKTYASKTTSETGCDGKSVNVLYAEGRAFNFVGGASASDGVGMVADVPDAIDCGVSGTQRFLWLQTATAAKYTYAFGAGASGIGMQVVYNALPGGTHDATTNTAGWTNANGCDGKSLAQLASEDRVFFMVGGSSGGGTATAAGNDGYIQFNTSNVLDAESTLFWDRINDRLSVAAGATPKAAIDVAGGVKLAADAVCDATKSGMLAWNSGALMLCTGAGGFVTILDDSFAETDPQVGTLTNGKWCSTDGTVISCTSDAPATGAAGSSSEVQFRNSGTGAFAADSNLIWDNTNKRLGIGTISPQSLLHVAGGIQLGDDTASCPGAGDVKLGTLRFNAGSFSVCLAGGWTALTTAGSALAAGSAGQIQFNGGSGVFAADAALHWDNTNKRLGIGTTSPDDPLHVQGDFRVTNGVNPAAGLQGIWWNTTGLSGTVLLQTIHTDIDLTDVNPGGQADNYSVRITGYVRSNSAGSYTFYNTADDGHRMWVNGTLLVDYWGDQGPTERSGTIALAANTWYPIVIEHYEATGGQRLVLQWAGPGISKQKIPLTNLAAGPQLGDVALLVDSVSGNLTVRGSAYKPGGGSWAVSSDARLKNIDGKYDAGLERVVRLKPLRFHYKKGNARNEPSDREFIGLIAQEAMEVMPELVSRRDDGYYDLDASALTFALINAVKELKADNDNLRTQLKAANDNDAGQEAAIEELRGEIRALKAGR